MPTDRAYLKQAQSGQIASTGCADPITAVAQAHETQFTFFTTAAGDFTENGYAITKAGRVKSVKVTPSGSLATHASNYFTGTVAKRDGAGGGATTIASFTTNSSGGAALTAFVPTDCTVSTTAGVADLAAGNVLTYKGVDAGTTTEPALTVVVTVEWV
jgi:hypothetical protein